MCCDEVRFAQLSRLFHATRLQAINARKPNFLGESNTLERTNQDPAHVKLPPLETVARARRERMMVVVPTEKNVTLSYEPSRLDRSSYAVTLFGIIMAVFLFRRRFRYGVAMPARRDSEIEPESNQEPSADSLTD